MSARRTERLRKKQPICIKCGKPVDSNAVIQHLVPFSAARWLAGTMPHCYRADVLIKKLESDANCVLVHPQCKSFTVENIDTLSHNENATTETVNSYRKFFVSLQNTVNAYLALARGVYKEQHGECYICGNVIPYKEAVMKRVDDRSPYEADNTCIWCRTCCLQSGRLKS